MTRRIPISPGWWPVFLALVPATGCVSYGVAIMVTGAMVGRQSSTAGIGAVLALMAAVLLAGVGLVAGRLVAHVLPEMSATARKHRTWIAALVLVVIAAVAYWQQAAPMLAADREATPRVLVNTVNLQRAPNAAPSGGLVNASRVLDSIGKVNQSIPWGQSTAHLVESGDWLEIIILPHGHRTRVALSGIDYISYVDAVPLRLGQEQRPALALLITGRATGRRDILCLIAEDGALLYQEILDRFWNFRTVPLAIAPSATGDWVLVGSDGQLPLAFTTQSVH
jgi:hypothetical protein